MPFNSAGYSEHVGISDRLRRLDDAVAPSGLGGTSWWALNCWPVLILPGVLGVALAVAGVFTGLGWWSLLPAIFGVLFILTALAGRPRQQRGSDAPSRPAARR